MSSRMFRLPGQAGLLVFTEAVLRHMYLHAQRKFFQSEAGGQLFSPEPHLPDILIDVVTGPYRKDRRRRHAFMPDIQQANGDRHHQFSAGRHAVGLWHTHPERSPSPSTQDLQTAREYLDAFGATMDGFLLVILGNDGEPLNMAVWLVHNALGKDSLRLNEV